MRGLEKLWGLTIREAPQVEATIFTLLNRDESDVLSKAWIDKDCAETLLDTWRKSRLSKELEVLLSLLEIADDKTTKRKRQDSSMNTSQTVSNLDPVPLVPPSHQSEPVVAKEESPPARYVATARKGLDQSQMQQASSSDPVALPSNAWELLDIYFSYTHCWLPILEKQHLFKASHSYPTSISSATPKSGDHAALWAALTYAESQLAGITRSRVGDRSMQRFSYIPTASYRNARRLIPDEDGVFELGHVQALILLALLNLGQNSWKQAWMLVGQAVRMAIELRLGEAPDDGKSRNKHVYMGCFVLETLIAARLKRPAHLITKQVFKHGLLQEDGLDEWTPWNDCLSLRRINSSTSSSRGAARTLSSFNYFARLVGILNTTMLHRFSSEAQEDHRRELIGLRTTVPSDGPGSMLPQQYYSELLYQALSSDGRYSIVALLDSLQTNYHFAVVPPILDCIILVYAENQTYLTGQNLGATLSPIVLSKLDNHLGFLSQVWPTFGSHDRIALGINSAGYSSPFRPTLPPSAGSYDRSIAKRRSTMESTFGTPSNSSVYTPVRGGFSEPAVRFDAFRLPAGTPNMQPTTSPWDLPAAFERSSSGNLVSQPSSTPANPQSAYQPFPSPIDEDSMFNEFATMDAMKWCADTSITPYTC